MPLKLITTKKSDSDCFAPIGRFLLLLCRLASQTGCVLSFGGFCPCRHVAYAELAAGLLSRELVKNKHLFEV